ncbi:MAG: archaeal proteasome endopeptidase complex subunit alpha [Methanomicrobia archaeon]|nr:archaeal proteasome endopeptidase complex subunit alpha [Methanomicrobia archaeon]MCK4433424.1 archaeal proteasome endopeptidase complex subunit alpha [Methanomicrobia archaeon]MCK4636248.1 archaeal proteasome endopeptidase complex subunit alpha [Methanomicrobia archaeon]
MMPKGMGYDRAITVFSPDGSLYQVSYASEAVKKGATALGVRCDEGIVLAVDKRIPSPMVEPESFEKIFKVDEHIGAATSGIISDARVLIDRARLEAQINRLTYSEPIATSTLAKKIGDLKQQFTQYGGLRPFGVSLIIAGVNDLPELFVTEPSGAYLAWKATAIGEGRDTAMKVFEDEYKNNMTMEEAIMLALNTLKASIEGEIDKSNIEMALLGKKTKKFEKLTGKKVKEYIEKLK